MQILPMTAKRFICMTAAWLFVFAVPAVAQTPALDVLARVAAQGRTAERGADNYTLELSVQGETGTEFVRPRAQSPRGVQYAAPNRRGEIFAAMGNLDAYAVALRQPQWTAEHQSMLSYSGVLDDSGAPAYVITAAYPLRTITRKANTARGLIAHFDTATLQLRRLELEIETPGGTVMWIQGDYSDFRPVEGFRIPFSRHLVVRGMSGRMDTAQIRNELTELRASLPGLASAEREEATYLLETLEALLSHHEVVNEVTVTSVRVNQRPPAGVSLRPRNAP